MAIKRINELPASSGDLSPDDLLVFMNDVGGAAVTKKATVQELADLIGSGGGGGNPFNQNLNTTDSPSFVSVTANEFNSTETGIKFSDKTIQNTAWTGEIKSTQVTDFSTAVNSLIPNTYDAAVEWTANHTLADGTRYLAGDLVYSGGNLYRAKFDNESLPVTDTTYWENVGPGYRLNIDGRDIPNIPFPSANPFDQNLNTFDDPTFDEITISGSKIYGGGENSGDGNGYGTLELIPDSGLYGNDQCLIIDPTAPNHIHLRAGGDQDNSGAQLIIGGENSNLSVLPGSNPEINITSKNNTWRFTTNDQTYYVMADVDGTIVTSVDGLNWSEPYDISNGIDHVATNDSTIVIIDDDEIGYTSFSSPSTVTTITATVSGITNIDLNQIIYGGGYFVVAGGGNDGVKTVPVYGYSSNGSDWAFKTVTGGLANTLANNNNENCEFSDVDYNGTGWNFAVEAAIVGGGVYTTDLTETFTDGEGGNYFGMVAGEQVAWNGNAWYYINSDEGSGFNTSTDPRQGSWDGPYNPWASSQEDLGINITSNISDTFCGGNGYLAFSDSDGHVSFSNDNGQNWTYVTPIPYTATITNIAYVDNKYQLTITGTHTSHADGEKITISGSSVSGYNGTYYLDDENFLYTDYQLTTPWAPEIDPFSGTATLTWSHGMYIDAMDYANGYFYIGNDDEQIARSSNLTNWTIVDDRNNAFEYWNDFSGYSTQYGNVGEFIGPNGATIGSFGMGWPGFYNTNTNSPVSLSSKDISTGSPYSYITIYGSNETGGTVNIGVATSGFESYLNWNFTENGSLTLPNDTKVMVGSFDNGTSGNKGISLYCAVGYELNWQGGHLKNTADGGLTSANILADSAIEFPGLGVDNMEINSSGLIFPDGTTQNTAASSGLTLEQVQDNLGTSFLVAGTGVNLTYNDASDTLTINNLHTEINKLSKEPQGFVNRNDSLISFDDSSRTFTIQPAISGGSYEIYSHGVKVVKNTIETVVLGSETALNYIHFDTTTGALHTKTTGWDFDTDIPIAFIHWNSDINQSTFFGEERHGIRMDSVTHKWIHNTFGMQYISGLSIGGYTLLGDGSSNSHAQFDISNGVLYQEDIVINIQDGSGTGHFVQELNPIAYIPVYYHSGSTGQWVRDVATPYAVKYNGTRAQYNLNTAGTWTTPNVTNDRFFAMWIVATNDINDPILAIMGQREDASLNSAESNNTWSSINLANIPTNEIRPLYRLIFKTNSSYTNTPKSSLQSILDIRVAIQSTVLGVTQNDHGSLFGLADDDHPQYVHIDTARTINAIHTFTNGLVVTGDASVDNLKLDGNTLSSTNTNGFISLVPNGTGLVSLVTDMVRVGDPNVTATITTNGSGGLVLNTNTGLNTGSITIGSGIANNITIAPHSFGSVFVDSNTLRVGNSNTAAAITTNGTGNLVLNTNAGTNSGNITITQGSNGNIVIAPNGTGDVQVDADTLRVGDSNAAATITTNGTGNLTLSTNGGTNSGTIVINQGSDANIELTPNGNGDVYLKSDSVYIGDNNVDAVITTNGTSNLTLNTNAGTNSGSITIEDGVDGNIVLVPNGTGKVGIANSGPSYTLDVTGGGKFTQLYPTVVDSGNVSGSVGTDVSTGQIFDMTLTGAATLSNPTNSVDGVTVRWRITQDGTGGHSVSLDTKFQIPSSASSPLPWSTAANTTDILAATYHAGRDKWDVVAFVPGY